MNQELRILGVMTGTSCDGLDAACVSIDQGGWEPLWTASLPYPEKLRRRVLAAQKPGVTFTTRQWLELNRDLGDWYATAIAKVIRGRKQFPHVIANHGQTIAHFPATGGRGVTLQMGEPTKIAQTTGLTVVSSFRDGDIAAGGQGAPLVPMFHLMLAHGLGVSQQGVAIHNIGGISNLTYISPRSRLVSFDTGPGNIWIDAAAELQSRGRLKMDRDGRLALRGHPDARLLQKWLTNPFFAAKPPKSTGRDDFPIDIIRNEKRVRGVDLIATATSLTVESIAQAYERFILKPGMPLRAIYICGGGALNPTLLGWLKMRLPETEIRPLDDVGFDSKAIEAQAFAVFGYLALCGRPLGGSWTGARGFGPPAHIIPGVNWGKVINLVTQLTDLE